MEIVDRAGDSTVRTRNVFGCWSSARRVGRRGEEKRGGTRGLRRTSPRSQEPGVSPLSCSSTMLSKLSLKAAVLCGLVLSAKAAQLPIGFGLSPESSPAFIGDDSFTTLSHPDPTNHVSVRIKKTKGWCDPDTRSYTGYIDAGPRHRESLVGEVARS